MTGVEHALQVVGSLDLPVGLATSSSERLIDAILTTLDLENIFAVVCSAAKEERGKPHPDVFLTTAHELGVNPSGCLVIEDSAFGVEAGKAAGMIVIAVPAPHQFDRKEFARADLKLRSLTELSVDAIERALS
jgi:sugar-phosphatase